MNIENALSFIQNFRAQLETLGITAEFLMVVGFFALVLFLLSLREVAGWFLRIGPLRQEIRSLKKQYEELQLSLDLIRDSLLRMENEAAVTPAAESHPVKPVPEQAGEAPGAKRFTFDH